MAEPDKSPVTLEEELLVFKPRADRRPGKALEKGLITREEFMQKISEERATYRKLLNPTPQ